MSPLTRWFAYMAVWCLIETLFTSVIKPVKTGGFEIRPTVFGKCAAVALPLYGLSALFILESYCDTLHFPQLGRWQGMAVRAMFCPIVIWWIEIVMGSILFYPSKWSLGHHPRLNGEGIRAWEYHGRGALCNRFVHLKMAPAWIALWPGFEFLYGFLMTLGDKGS